MAKLDTLELSAAEIQDMTKWPHAMIESYLNMNENILILADRIDGVSVGVGPTDILTTDTTVINGASIVRYTVAAMSSFNSTGGVINMSIYSSPDLTSASGALIETVPVPAGGSAQFDGVIGQTYTDNLIAVADAVGANLSTTYTEFTSV